MSFFMQFLSGKSRRKTVAKSWGSEPVKNVIDNRKGTNKMKRQELEELGLSKEQIDKVIKINGTDIENAKVVATSGQESIKAEYEALKTQLKDRDNQIEQLKGSVGNNEDLKRQIEELQATNKAKEKEHQQAITKLKIDAEVDKALLNAKARNTKAVSVGDYIYLVAIIVAIIPKPINMT